MTMNWLPARDIEALDQPIWSALTSKHRSLAIGGEFARRYPASIAPFAAMSGNSPEAIEQLRNLTAAGPMAVLGLNAFHEPNGLVVQFKAILHQMLSVGDLAADEPALSADMAVLGEPDVPAMLELAGLTKPGPFLEQTYRLGRYIGIRDGYRLAAMAGERMRLDGYTEISAVCVHPDYRGKGYAQRLIKSLVRMISEGGNRPFLHVLDENQGAIALYERLGFVKRRTLHLTVMQRPGQGGEQA